jgi:hypothetical protein
VAAFWAPSCPIDASCGLRTRVLGARKRFDDARPWNPWATQVATDSETEGSDMYIGGGVLAIILIILILILLF